MAADYKILSQYIKNIQSMNSKWNTIFFEQCSKELAARLLNLTVKNTPTSGEHGGTLKRGWTGGKSMSAKAYVETIPISHIGDKYIIDLSNNVEYASYVEYGHRTRNHKGWVEGQFMLTLSEEQLNAATPAILARKLNKYMKEWFE